MASCSNKRGFHMAKNVYDNDFYRDRQSRTGYSANTVLHHLLRIVPPVSSAVDIGCGVGTWLSVLEGLGATDILGVDGPWVPLESLTIRRERLIPRRVPAMSGWPMSCFGGCEAPSAVYTRTTRWRQGGRWPRNCFMTISTNRNRCRTASTPVTIVYVSETALSSALAFP